MCGRFLSVNDEEIFPSFQVEIATVDGPITKSWGITNKKYNRRLINARAETVNELPTFKRMQPCVIPAMGYYEWDNAKNKYLFSALDKQIIFMAGVYSQEGFVILTKDAQPELMWVHNRMPYIVKEQDMQDWLEKRHIQNYIQGYDYLKV